MYTRTHMHTFVVASVSAVFALNRVLDWELVLGPGYLGFSTGSSYLKASSPLPPIFPLGAVHLLGVLSPDAI